MKTPTRYAVVIVAGGKGLRLKANTPKQFLVIGTKPMLMHTIEKFYNFDSSIQIVIVIHKDFIEYWKDLCTTYKFSILHQIVEGGATRFHSVKKGLELIETDSIVAIHDAARPFVTSQLIAQCFHYSKENQCGVIPVTEEKNSIRIIENDSHRSIDRRQIKIVQTPQVFPSSLIKQAYMVEYNELFTDDATVAENSNVPVFLVQGEDTNIKITTSFDMLLAKLLLEEH